MSSFDLAQGRDDRASRCGIEIIPISWGMAWLLFIEKGVDGCVRTDKKRADHFLVGRFQHNWDDSGSVAGVIGKTHGSGCQLGSFHFSAFFNFLHNLWYCYPQR